MNRATLIDVFNNNAEAYEAFRPKYPLQLIKELISFTDTSISDHILEIGCGTGQLTMGLVELGFGMVALERGEQLCQIARQKLEPYANTRLIHADFEKWQTDHKFKLIVSAQAFHWIDYEIGLNKCSKFLDRHGWLALIWNIDESRHTAFWRKSSPIYQKFFPANGAGKSIHDVSIRYQNYLEKSCFFEFVGRREYPRNLTFSKRSYLGLLTTFSNHMTLKEDDRIEFFNEIGKAIDEVGGTVKKEYNTVMLLAKKNG